MHGLVPHGYGVRRIVCNSGTVGIRQSQRAAKPAKIVVPPSSLLQAFNLHKLSPNTRPSAGDPAGPDVLTVLQLYVLSASCGLLKSMTPSRLFVSTHCSPVS